MIDKLISGPFSYLARSLIKYKYIYLASTVLLTVVAFSFLTKIKLDANFTSLLSEDHPVILNLEKISKIYGGVGSLVLVIRSDDYQKGVDFVENSVTEIKKYEEVRYIDYIAPQAFFENNLLMYIEANDLRTMYRRIYRKIDYHRQKESSMKLLGLSDELKDPGLAFKDIIDKYKDKYGVKEDETKKRFKSPYFHKVEGEGKKEKHTFVVLIKPQKPALDNAYSREIVEKISGILDQVDPASYQAGIKYNFTGRYVKKNDSIRAMGDDLSLVSWVSALGVLLILIIYFRSFWPIVLVFSSLLVGIIWTMGLTQILLAKLNLVTSFLVAILFGLGIDFGIHYIVRYREEREAGVPVEEAFTRMITQTGVASFTSGLTTAFAFLILIISGFNAFVEFGIIAGMGVVLILTAMTLFMGSLLLVIETHFTMKFNKKRISFKLPVFLFQKPAVILGSAVVLTGLAFWGFQKINFDYDFGKLVSYDHLDSYRLDKEVNAMFDRSLTPNVIVPRSPEHEERIISSMQKNINANRDNPDNRIDRVVGLSTFIPSDQQNRLREIRRIRNLIQKNKKYKPLMSRDIIANFNRIERALQASEIGEDDLPASIRNNFQGIGKYKDNHVVLVFPLADFSDGKQILEFSEQVSQIKVDGKPLDIASDSLVFAEVLKLIQRDGYAILFYCLIGVYVLVTMNFRSFSRALTVLVPLTTGIFWMAGAMGIFDVKVDFFNVIVFPIIIGIGIDSGVHIFHRYSESKDMMLSVRNTGEAVALSSITTMIGFGALSIGNNKAMNGIGNVAIIGIMCTYMVSVFLLPALVLAFKKNKGASQASKAS